MSHNGASHNGEVTRRGQQLGTATNDDAVAGNLGEYVSSIIASGSAVSLTTDTPANITSISLTAGDWEVWGVGQFAPAGTTTVAYILCCLSTTSATLVQTSGRVGAYAPGGAPTLPVAYVTVDAGPMRFSLSSTTTVYLVAQSGFGTSTMGAYGALQARRIR